MIQFYAHSGIYTLYLEQLLPISKEEAWDFFSSPGNLEKITPDKMDFKVTSPIMGNKIYPGQIITYKVAPFMGIKTNWVTEITQVKQYEFFIDEQRSGPYFMWHHEHHFNDHEKGVLMVDKVSYKLPFGFIGDFFHPLIVKPQLKKIFNFRYNTLENYFYNSASNLKIV